MMSEEVIMVLVISVRSKQRSKGRILGIVCGEQQVALRRQGHLVDPRRAAGGNRLLQRSHRGRIEIEDFQGAVSIAPVDPATMGRHAIRSRVVVIDGSRPVELYADEAAEGSFPLELMGVDDVNSRIRAVTQVILAAVRIDPADIERSQRIAGYKNARDALGLGGGWSPGAGARACDCPGCYR